MRISSQSHGIGHLMQIRMSNGLETSQKKSLGKPGFTHYVFLYLKRLHVGRFGKPGANIVPYTVREWFNTVRE